VRNATGVGIAAMGFAAARQHLLVSDTRVSGGAPAGRADAGIAGLAEGPDSEVHLRIDSSTVSGRMSRLARNVVVFASAGARASGSIQRSTLGESGQDGVIAIAALIPATVALVIRDSVVENAAQTNVEGTILNLPAFDPARAHDATVSIEIVGSTIRGAGAVAGFETDPIGIGNVWLGSSAVMQQADPKSPQPFAPGSYRLVVRNSRIERARDFGVGAGGWRSGLAAETAAFDLSIRESSVVANGAAELLIAAPNARVDARQNCWGTDGGLSPDRIHRRGTAAQAQIDTSEPSPCTASGARGGTPR
jgi:hypothetical protein